MLHTENHLARYLLREVTDAEQERIETEFLVDDDAFARLGIVEDDLIDAYVRGELPPVELQQFEERWLSSPQRRARVDLALELAQVADRTETASRPWWAPLDTWWKSWQSGWQLQVLRTVPALGLVVAVIGLGHMQNVNTDLRSQIELLEAKTVIVGGQEPSLPATVPTLWLEPATRSGDRQKLWVDSQAGVIRLLIPVAETEGYPSLEASLSEVRGPVLETWDELSAGRAVVLEVPSELVPEGRFAVELRGQKDSEDADLLGYYELEIVSR